jgi:hypothetical protein
MAKKRLNGSIPIRNTFEGGMNKDVDERLLPGNIYRDAENMELVSYGDKGVLVTLQGMTFKAALSKSGIHVTDNNILGVFEVFADVDWADTGDYTTVEALLIFVYDATTGSTIYLWDIINQQEGILFPDAGNPQDLTFDSSSTVRGFYYKHFNTNSHYFHWVDGRSKNVPREIELKIAGTHTYPDIVSLSQLPIAAWDRLDFVSVTTGGGLVSGSYSLAYRRYNTTTGRSSAWSNWTNPIHIIVGDTIGASDPTQSDSGGGLVGEPTNKQIQITFSGTDGDVGFDAIQLAVVKYVDGSKLDPQVVFITNPRTEWFTGPITFTGNESGAEFPIETVLVDNYPLRSAKELIERDGRAFYKNYERNKFEYDNGVPTFTTVFTKTEVINGADDSTAYNSEDDASFKKGWFRGELYALGYAYVDEYGNYAPVRPFDFSSFLRTSVESAAITTGTPGAYTAATDETVITVGSTTGLVAGDLIRLDSTDIMITRVVPATTIHVQGDHSALTPGSIDLLYGQKGNQGTSWAWKFASRYDSQFSIMDNSGQIHALSLRIEGFQNHPSWAKGVEFFVIKREKKNKDVLFQTPYIPMVGIQGVPTVGNWLNDNNKRPDYKGELDHIIPKVFTHGTARNIVRRKDTMNSDDYWVPEWIRQEGNPDANRKNVCNYWWAVPPEYMYNNEGVPYQDYTIVNGNQAEIIDMVYLLRQGKVLPSDYTTRGPNYNATKAAVLYSAAKWEQYYYNRDGTVDVGGSTNYFKKIEEWTYFTNLGYSKEIGLKHSIVTSKDNPFLTLPHRPFADQNSLAAFPDEALAEIIHYGRSTELSRQQGEHPSIGADESASFGHPVKNQRGMMLYTDTPLEDPTRMMKSVYDAGDNLFNNQPVGEVPITYMDTDSGFGDFFNASGYSVIRGGNYTNVQNSDADDQNVGALYIVNVKAGLGDDRYGPKENVNGTWISTGLYVPLTAAQVSGNTPINVELSGDCYISKCTFKIHDSTPKIVKYDSIEEERNAFPRAIEDAYKVGTHQTNVELIEVWLESEVNATYAGGKGVYPETKDLRLNTYNSDYNYEYNFGYSAKPIKVFEGFNAELDKDNVHESGIIWSDEHQKGKLETGFSDVLGFNKVRINNRIELDPSKGPITGSVSLGDKMFYVIQERGVWYQPIGVNEMRTDDQNIISISTTGTGKILGAGGRYLRKTKGCQHIRTITEWDGVCHFLDVRNKQLCRFALQTGIDTVSIKGLEQFLDEKLEGRLEIPDTDLIGIYDADKDRYMLTDLDQTSGNEWTICWNNGNNVIQGDIGFAELQMIFDTTTRLRAGVFAHQKLYMMTDKSLAWELYSGFDDAANPCKFFGVQKDASFSVVPNNPNDRTLVFDVLTVDASEKLSSVDISILDESTAENQVVTGIDLNFNKRRGVYHQNQLRWVNANSNRVRFRGRYALIKINIDMVGDGVRKVEVYNVETSAREYIRN